ncbi:MAG TPA: hypothetical protein VMD99_05330 [Terriglobales bacterium]|nr:hypothetical protein [Terriglobales bacterium]
MSERNVVLRIWPDPEVFRIVYISKGTTWTTSPDLMEEELRVELGKLGHTRSECDSRIERARECRI